MSTGGKQPLFSLDAEQSVLGSVLISPDAIDRIELAPDEFYRPEHGRIFAAMVALQEAGTPIDLTTLSDALFERGELDGVGGTAFLAGLISSVPGSVNVAHYARTVRSYAARRQLLDMAGRMAATANEETNAGDALERTQAQISSLQSRLVITASAPTFSVNQGAYIAQFPSGARLEFDYVQHERTDLWAELTAQHITAAGAKTLLRSRVNLLRGNTRRDVARDLVTRSNGHKIDWADAVEQATQWVTDRVRAGEPAILLRDVEEVHNGDPLLGPFIPPDGTEILFGDGGAFKSYVALAFGLSLHTGMEVIKGLRPRQKMRVAYLDWEWSGAVHKRRMRAIIGDAAPDIVYVSCRMPLKDERDRIRRIIREHQTEYLFLDSAALAAGGDPNEAEVAIGFFNALRELELPSTCIAHVNKSDRKDATYKPLGSSYWSHSARSTWYVRRSDTASDPMQVGLFHRKTNDGPRHPDVGLSIAFTMDEEGHVVDAAFARTDVRDVPDLAANVPLRSRIQHLLTNGSLTYEQIAEELDDVKPETVRRTIQRGIGFAFTSWREDGKMKVGLLTNQPVPG